MKRRPFLIKTGLAGAALLGLSRCSQFIEATPEGIALIKPLSGEDIFQFVNRVAGRFDLNLYRGIIGAANEFKEGDQILGVSAANEESRNYARQLILKTRIKDLNAFSLYEDAIYNLISSTTLNPDSVSDWSIGDLKNAVLELPESELKNIIPSLTSDVIACLVKVMSGAELIRAGSRIFNPLPGSKIGSKGYMGARVQPNSPTDDPEDIRWQVFNAWSFGVGDVVLGTNPVSSDHESVARIEQTLVDVLKTFGLENTIPNCVLAHIDIQAAVEEKYPGTTGIWFQSIASTVKANQTFDVTVEKMFAHASRRTGKFGIYAETGQGADATNGHGEGVDMVVHESRKYGFLRALRRYLEANKTGSEPPWVFVNDVAGFIGPEVFRSREQLVRCCLEDIVMGKLHGHTIGLDICSTLHMDIDLDDLEWCIDQIMPANPAYMMALPTKNDPMLSYLTTAFNDHVRVREKFGYKVNDDIWNFFKRIGVIGEDDKPGVHFGDPVWVYYQYCLARQDTRSRVQIYEEGRECISRVRKRGVPIAEGFGNNFWDMDPELENQVRHLYSDAKKSIWMELPESFAGSIPGAILLNTRSADRKDYVYHPESGEKLSAGSVGILQNLRKKKSEKISDVQIIISDGLCPDSLTDDGHLEPFLDTLKNELKSAGIEADENILVIRSGRVRAGYSCGEYLFGNTAVPGREHGIIHIIGERPGSGHHSFSAYLTVASAAKWSEKGVVDHDITRVVSGISDTSILPEEAARESVKILKKLFS